MSSQVVKHTSGNSGSASNEQYTQFANGLISNEQSQEGLFTQKKSKVDEIRTKNTEITQVNQWLKDHSHWYNNVTVGAVEKGLEKLQKLKSLKSQRATLTRQLNTILGQILTLSKNFGMPIYTLNLQIEQLFHKLSSGQKIGRAMMQDIMALMSQVMALIQVILAKVDAKKGRSSNSVSEASMNTYKEAVSDSTIQYKSLVANEKLAKIMKVMSVVFKVVMVVAALAIAALTAGAGSFLVALAISAVMVSGAAEKLTSALEKALPNTAWGKVAANVIAIAIITVATAGVGAFAMVGEQIASQLASQIGDEAFEEVADSVAEEIAQNITQEVSGNFGLDVSDETIANSVKASTKKLARSIANKMKKELLEEGAHFLVKQSVATTMKEMIASGLQGGIKNAMKQALEKVMAEETEAVTEAVTANVRADLGDATEASAEQALKKVANKVAEGAPELLKKEAINSVSKLGSLKLGASLGVGSTNILPDLVGAIIDSTSTNQKKKKWYKTLMIILKVVQAIIAMVMIGMASQSMMNGSAMSKLKAFSKLNRASTIAMGVGSVGEGTTGIVQGQIMLNKSDVIKTLAADKAVILLMQFLLKELNALSQTRTKRESSEIKSEAQNTRRVSDRLNDGAQAVARALQNAPV